MTEQTAKITADMSIKEVVKNYPQTIRVFLEHGLMCFGCAIAQFESLRDGAVAHGIDIDALIADLNRAIA